MVAVLDALGLARVDVYGDSYGSFAAQALVLRHPGRVRSLVLDGTYPLDFDPWARDALTVLRSALRATCARARRPAPGRAATPSSASRRSRASCAPARSWRRRAMPAALLVHVRLDDRGLAGVLTAADGALAIYRDLPAAAEAYDRGDRAPLARLAAEAFSGGANGPAQYYSAGLDAAVECHDYPQLFDISRLARRTARPARRGSARAARERVRAVRQGDLVRRRPRELRLVRALAAPGPCPRSSASAWRRLSRRSRRSCWTATSISARR